MIVVVFAFFAVLLSHPDSGAGLQEVTPEEKINEAVSNINKYNSENKYQNLQFNDYEVLSAFYVFTASKVQLGDLSTIQLKSNTQPSINTVVSNLGTTHYYNATFELQKGFAEYDYLLKFLHLISSSGTVTATGKHSFQAIGTVKISSVKKCQADISAISVKLGHLQATITPGGLFHYFITPFIRYLTNSYSQEFLPSEAQIADYIKNSIPKSKFSELVCDAFNKPCDINFLK